MQSGKRDAISVVEDTVLFVSEPYTLAMSAPSGPSPEPPSREAQERDERRLGFDETRNYFTEAMQPLIPQRLAVWGMKIEVIPTKERYQVGEPIEFEVVFYNRLPVPVAIETPSSRCWYWAVDGEPFASDERPYIQNNANSFPLRARERKRITQTWDGRFRRDGDLVRWIPATAGTHSIGAVLETAVGSPHLSAETQIYIES